MNDAFPAESSDEELPPVPTRIQSDFGPDEAEFVHLLPSEVACERIAFSAKEDEVEPEGYFISLKALRANPGRWAFQLRQKKTRPHHQSGFEMLAAELKRRGAS